MLLDLDLRQFRCHSNLHLSFQPGWNLILGANGEGKSSILEAIYYLGRLKSFRTSQIREMVLWQQQGFHIGLRYQSGAQVEELSIRWEKGNRQCLINGQSIDTLDEFWGRIPMVLLAADDQMLVRGPTIRRQQWLDSLVAYGKVGYLSLVQRYNTTLRQRNAWLRQRTVDRRVGEVLTVQLTQIGQKITEERSLLLVQIDPLLKDFSGRLIPGDHSLKVEYHPSFVTGETPDWDRVQDNERRLGRTLLGPHRDEIRLTLHGQPLVRYGSEGEQRMGALLLRLTEVYAIHQARGIWPLLLLDDVLSPLDATRKVAWTREIPFEVQTILATTAWPSDFATPEKWTAWELRQGALYQL